MVIALCAIIVGGTLVTKDVPTDRVLAVTSLCPSGMAWIKPDRLCLADVEWPPSHYPLNWVPCILPKDVRQ
jgi:hypothetical protein